MQEIIGFLAMMIGSLIDPIMIGGYLVSGCCFKKRTLAIKVSVAWNLLIHFGVLVTSGRNNIDVNPFDVLFFASICGAILVTLFIHAIASEVRTLSSEKNLPDTND